MSRPASSLPWPPKVRFQLDRFTHDLIDAVFVLESKDDKPEHLRLKEINEGKELVWRCIGEDAQRRTEAARWN